MIREAPADRCSILLTTRLPVPCPHSLSLNAEGTLTNFFNPLDCDQNSRSTITGGADSFGENSPSVSPVSHELMIRSALFVLLPCILFSQNAGKRRPIAFEDFPVDRVFSGPAVQPKFSARHDVRDADPRFREAVTDAVRKGPNFAAVASVVEMSCGTGCEYIAVARNETGTVSVDMPFFALLVGPFRDSIGNEHLGGVKYRLTSRLLIAEGCFDSTSGANKGYFARAYYVWTGSRFKLLRRIPLDWGY
jgi:hypothetical protein